MRVKLWIARDTYGVVQFATFGTAECPTHLKSVIRSRFVSSTKQLVQAMTQAGSRQILLDAAWRMAVREGALEASRPFKAGDDCGADVILAAQLDAETLDHYIAHLVNSPTSRFYIHG